MMKRRGFHLDFRSAPATVRRVNATVLVIVALAVGAALGYVRYLHQSVRVLERESALLVHAISHPVPTGAKPAAADTSSISLQRQLNIPWQGLLDGLEAAASGRATLVFMQPNVRQGEVTLGGEAARYADVLDYIERLKAQPGFEQAYLTNHEVAETTPGNPVRFNILLKWRIAG